MGLAHVATADEADSNLGTPSSLRPKLPVATGCKTRILRIERNGNIRECGPCCTLGGQAMTDTTIRLTVAQAIVRYLMNQFIEIDGTRTRICGGGFGIFGHGNVPCLGEALYPVRRDAALPRPERAEHGLRRRGLRQVHLRRRFMFCTASAGPGTANLLTAAALAHANRLPMLMLCGDTFLTRLPDPVLQQLEHFGNPALGLNDAFKAVTRYWDRITHPAQIIQTLPAAIATMLDPADCGPAFLGLPQDVQGWAYDYPESFFAPAHHRIRRQAPDAEEVADAAAMLRGAKRPMIIAGGGVQYSGAVAEMTAFAEATHSRWSRPSRAAPTWWRPIR
jgi:3D-(3,5/4)-trihydroxycyclohexane-1,2-dione acylhydrolase (decyclizing)